MAKGTLSIAGADTLTAADLAPNSVGSSELADDAVTGANIAYLGDGSGNLSGTLTGEQLRFGTTFTLDDNLTVNGDVTLAKVGDDSTGQTLTHTASTARTITGTGTLRMGSSLSSVEGMTGALGKGVTFNSAMSIGGTFTYDTATATGTQAVTGVGFRPSGLTLFAAMDTAGQASYGIGAPGMNRCVADKQAWVGDYWVPATEGAIYMIQSSSINSAGSVQSFDADGFTISWTKTGSKTGTVFVYYIAVR